MLGDWSKLPSWLFPKVPGFQSAFGPWYPTPVAGGPAPGTGKLGRYRPDGGSKNDSAVAATWGK